MRTLSRYTALLALAAAMLAGCGNPLGNNRKETIFVSIAPLRTLVREITGDDFDVRVIVPAGASPESFEPSLRQVAALNNAQLVFSVGLIDFEQNLVPKLAQQSKLVDLSRGIQLIAGQCSHHHHGHSHGTDPHIWNSPATLKTMADNAFNAIKEHYPDSVKYETAYRGLCEKLDALDTEVQRMCSESEQRYFVIYHPALTYLARDYGLEQIAIEHEGKEPGAKRLAQIIDRTRNDGIKKIFYQSQFPASVVRTIADDIGAEPVEIDPLAEDIFAHTLQMVRLITRQ